MPDTVAGDTSTTGTVNVGGYVDVVIDTTGDHDWYAVTLVAGHRYTFSTNDLFTSDVDTYLSLRNSSGTILVSDDDGGPGTLSQINFLAVNSGTYYIDATTYNSASTGSYRLRVVDTAPSGSDTVAGDVTTTGTVTVGGATVSGAINTAGDHDWFAVTLTAGQSYIFQTVATGQPVNAEVDTVITLRDANGNELSYNDDRVDTYSGTRFTASTSGTYYVDVGAFNNATTGLYDLQAVVAPPLEIYTNDQISDQLTDGYWSNNRHHFNVTPGGTLTFNLTALTAAGQNLAREALNLWSDVTGITFSETSGAGQITFDDNESGAFANAVYSGGITTSANVNVSTEWLTTYGTGLNTYAFQSYIHEIGHALGLGHAGDYNGDAEYANDALYQNDAWITTIMSYFSPTENTYFANQGFTRQYTISPMVADILSMVELYGTPSTTRTGDTTYGFNNNSGRAIYDATQNAGVAYTIYDSGGIDTLDYSGFSYNQSINLNPETFSNVGGSGGNARVGNVSIARGVTIENAIGGSGNDTLTGNDVNNMLTGNGGTDTLNGGLGDDTLNGGLGNDTLNGGDGTDIAVFSGARSGYTLGTPSSDAFTVSGADGSDSLTGVERLQFSDGTYRYSAGGSTGTQPTLAGAIFGMSASAGGWSDDRIYPRAAGDINGDGNADLVGFGSAGVFVSLADGHGGFGSIFQASSLFGTSVSAGGWANNDLYPRMLGDINGDGRADLLGFGAAGVYAALGQVNGGFGEVFQATQNFGADSSAGGWSSNNAYPRMLADINGDGRDDLVGFGDGGVFAALGQVNGSFGSIFLATASFGAGASAGGWANNDLYTRTFADIDGDGNADIVGFGATGVFAALGNGNGTFGSIYLAYSGFGGDSSAGGWTSNDHYYRTFGDVNGDGRDDIVAFGDGGVYVAESNGSGGFGAAALVMQAYGNSSTAGGWTSYHEMPRTVVDINGDGRDDVIGFGIDGTYVAEFGGTTPGTGSGWVLV